MPRIRKGDSIDWRVKSASGAPPDPPKVVAEKWHRRIPFKIYFFGKAKLYKPRSKRWDEHYTLFCFEVFDFGDYYRLSDNNKQYDISMAFGPGTKKIPKHPAFKRTLVEAAAYHIAEKRIRIDEIRKRLKSAVSELEDIYQNYVYPAGVDIESVEDYAQEFYRRTISQSRSRQTT
jgi:hypothetical protein